MKTNLRLLAFIISLFAVTTAFSQKKTRLAISVGPTINDVYGKMVRRNDDFGGNYKKRDKIGYAFNAGIEHKLLSELFLYSGLSLVQKQINPMEESSSVYRDKLKTMYLTLPLGVGFDCLPPNEKIGFTFLAGSFTNLRIADKSKSGPDRVGFKTSAISESLSGGVRLSLRTEPGKRVYFQYNYIHDVTDTYIETLYWSNVEPRKEFDYRYNTHTLVMGFSWEL